MDKINGLNAEVLTKRYWRSKNSPLLCESWCEVAKYNDAIRHTTLKVNDYEAFYEQKPLVLYPKYSNIAKINAIDLNCIVNKFMNSGTHIYTDASKSADGVGGAFYIPSTNTTEQFKLPDITSIFTAEVYAILKALYYVESQSISNFVIISDSQSALKSIQHFTNPLSIMNRFIRLLILQMHRLKTKGYKFLFVWVKAHIGVTDNEKVDRLAKEGCFRTEIDCTHISSGDIVNAHKHDIKAEWKQWWNSYCQNFPTRYTGIQPTLPDHPWYYSISCCRSSTVSIIRMRTGHGTYPAHLHKLNLLENDICQLCHSEVGDIDHLLFDCRHHYQHCTELYNEILKIKIPAPFNSAFLLSQDLKVYQLLINFLRKSQIKI